MLGGFETPRRSAMDLRNQVDGYRAKAVKSDGKLTLFSRRRKSFNEQFPFIVEALDDLPTNTVIDGELVAINQPGRPDFKLLQSFRSEASRIHYFVFGSPCLREPRSCAPAADRAAAVHVFTVEVSLATNSHF